MKQTKKCFNENGQRRVESTQAFSDASQLRITLQRLASFSIQLTFYAKCKSEEQIEGQKQTAL